MQGYTCSQLSLCHLHQQSEPLSPSPNLLFPYIQLHLQGLQHPASPYGAFLPCAPVLRWGCKHPGLQSSPGKNGQQQQHQTVAAGNGRGIRRLRRSMGSRLTLQETRVVSDPSCQQRQFYWLKCSFLMLFPYSSLDIALPRIKPAFPMKGLRVSLGCVVPWKGISGLGFEWEARYF